MNEFPESEIELTWSEPRSTYDVVIVGGGGHGLSTAYHLATRHGITDVLVLEASYIGSGNSGRNTTVVRSNYGIPEAVRFYQHSVERYRECTRISHKGNCTPSGEIRSIIRYW